jgi:hypothetical protein
MTVQRVPVLIVGGSLVGLEPLLRQRAAELAEAIAAAHRWASSGQDVAVRT